MNADTEPNPPDRRVPFRERHRAARRQEFLDVARHLLRTEGDHAVTMQRLTTEVNCSLGGIYVYFASRDALLAELYQEAVDIVLSAYRAGHDAVAHHLADIGATATEASIVALLCSCVFWADAQQTLPAEIGVAHRTLHGGSAAADVETPGLGLELVSELRSRLDAASSAGAITGGNNTRRAVMLLAGMTGFTMVTRQDGWATGRFDNQLAIDFAVNTLRGWGAGENELANAVNRIDAFRLTNPIAPPGPAT